MSSEQSTATGITKCKCNTLGLEGAGVLGAVVTEVAVVVATLVSGVEDTARLVAGLRPSCGIDGGGETRK